MLIFEAEGKPENPEKTLGARARTNNKLNPHMTPGPGIEPGTHWWEASALITAPPQLPWCNIHFSSCFQSKSRTQIMVILKLEQIETTKGLSISEKNMLT